MKKLLDVCSLFMAVIGSCAAVLTCFILFIYPNLGNNDSADNKDITVSQTADNSMNTALSTSDYQNNISLAETLPDNSASVDYQNTESSPIPMEHTVLEDTNISAEYTSALNKANDYSNIMHMSKAAIYNQLTSEYGERFSTDAAQYAIDSIVADWNSNALQKAQEYSDTMNMSVSAIHDQLTSEYGERFTQEEADYAVANIQTDSNTNSVIYTEPIVQNNLNNYATASPVQAIDNQNFSNTYNSPEQSQNTVGATLVWIDDTAARYHKNDGCGMDNAYQVTLEEALQKGKTPCGRCYK